MAKARGISRMTVSRINLVERWFAALTTQQLRRGAHRSVSQLDAAIHDGGNVTRDLKAVAHPDVDWRPAGLPAHSRHYSGTCGLRRRAPAAAVVSRASSFVRVDLARPRRTVRDVAEILGHSDVRLTLGTYAHVHRADSGSRG